MPLSIVILVAPVRGAVARAPPRSRRSSDRSRACGSSCIASRGHRRTSSSNPSVLAAFNPYLRRRASWSTTAHRPRDPRRGLSGGDRRGGALRRPRPFRAPADPGGMVCFVLPALVLNYFGQGALVLGTSGGDRESLLPDVPGLGASADGRARHRRDRHRQPGGHHRRLFAEPAGGAAWPAAAPRDPPHVGVARRPDLHAAGQLRSCSSACCCWSASSARPSALAGAYGIAVTGTMVVTAMLAFVVVWRVWNWNVFARGRAGRSRSCSSTRPSSLANLLKILHGGWFPVLLGVFADDRHADLAARQPHPLREDAPARGAARRSGHAISRSIRRRASPAPRSSSPAIRTQHADGAPPQPQALQGAAREERHHDGEDRRHAAGRPARPRDDRRGQQTPSRASPSATASWRRRTCRRRSPSRARQGFTFDIMSTTFFLSRRSLQAVARRRACRSGRTSSSSCWRATPTMPRATSGCRPTAWSRSARRSRLTPVDSGLPARLTPRPAIGQRSRRMTLHLIKLCVGCDSVEDLVEWIDVPPQGEAEGAGEKPEHIHVTRMVPKRIAELLDGGSLYWVIKGTVQVRQRLLDIRPFVDEEGIGRCRLVLEPKVVPTEWQPKRPFQGWRYLEAKDAPRDLKARQAATTCRRRSAPNWRSSDSARPARCCRSAASCRARRRRAGASARLRTSTTGASVSAFRSSM